MYDHGQEEPRWQGNFEYLSNYFHANRKLSLCYYLDGMPQSCKCQWNYNNQMRTSKILKDTRLIVAYLVVEYGNKTLRVG